MVFERANQLTGRSGVGEYIGVTSPCGECKRNVFALLARKFANHDDSLLLLSLDDDDVLEGVGDGRGWGSVDARLNKPIRGM
jgi:hypothetical protein